MSWLVAVCRPSQERRALAGLEERGIWAWLPMRSVEFKTRHMRKTAVRQYPLFPGYLFAREPEACALDRRSTAPGAEILYGVDGVRGLLCNDFRPLRLSDPQVEALRRDVDTPAPIVEDVWRIGETIIVTDGPFASLPGTVTRLPKRGIIAVLLNIFGGATPVEMETCQLRRVA